MIFRVHFSNGVLFTLIYLLLSCISSTGVYGQISVKFWAENKKSAFTFSFDDNCMSQYTYGAPLLDSFKFKGTFAVITDSMTDNLPGIARYGTWNQFRSLSLEGHEIGSHSVTHPDLTKLVNGDTSIERTLLYELYQSQKVINQKIPNQKCIVMVYPNLAYTVNVEEQTAKFYAAGRTGGTFPVDGSLAGLEYYRIVSNEALFNLPRNSPSDDLDELAAMEIYADSCVKVGGWGLLELHEIVPFSQIPQLVAQGEWYPTSTEWLTSFCEHIKQNSDSNLVWVETMGNVTRYMRERQVFQWDILTQTNTQMTIHGYDTLDDQIYNYPLTVDIQVPAGWLGAIFSQGSRSDTLYTFTADGITYVRTHFIPDGGTVILNRIIPVIAITSPNGGENWRVGGVDTVKWTSSNITYVKIELTTNNETSWLTIKDSVSAPAGRYAWTIPDSVSTQCKVRLTDVADTSIKSMSAAVFTISPIPALTITSPNGGENWKVGEIDTVKWTSSNITYAKIELTTNNGTSWLSIKDSVSASIGRYAWTIPDSPSTACKVRLTDLADTSIKSMSADTFSISLIPTVNISVLIEGLYNGTSMSRDTVIVELRHSTPPFALADSIKKVLDTAGVGTFTFTNAVNDTQYYLVVRHRNSIETWSASTISFHSVNLNYDFTSGPNKAYGNNLIVKGGKACIYSGDVNQDGLVDLSDLVLVDNDNANYVTGFAITDVNGDGLVDLSDLVIVDNNNINYISEQVPPGASTIKNVKTRHEKAVNNQD
jgi:peptidoglycan/xylan/chitin deacetylase (PgdA/CDA1 family)